MSLSRRMQLLSWANETDGWISEDDFGSELRYSGPVLSSLQGLDTEGRVIYMGTFNMIMFPALHLTYLVLPQSLVAPFVSTLHLTGYHDASVEQAALADFIRQGHFTRHIRRMWTVYSERQAALIRACRRHLAGILEVSESDAGLHLVAWLVNGMDDRQAAALAASESLYTTPLSSYYAKDPSENVLLLGYASSSPRQLGNAVERLARALTGTDSAVHLSRRSP